MIGGVVIEGVGKGWKVFIWRDLVEFGIFLVRFLNVLFVFV